MTLSNPAIEDASLWVSHITLRARKISEMMDEHIISCIEMIQRGTDASGIVIPEWCKLKAPMLILEANGRGLLGKLEIESRIKEGWDA